MRDGITMANMETQRHIDNVAEQQKQKIEKELYTVFEEAKSKLDNIDRQAKNEKKLVIVQLAKDLEGKVPTDTISIEIVNQLHGKVSERFIHECLDNKYKQKYRAENAKKRKTREKGNEVNLAAVALLNNESKRRVITIDAKGRSRFEDAEQSSKQHASHNVVEDTHIATAKARSLQLAIRKQECEISQSEAHLGKSNKGNRNIESYEDKIKCPNQINEQDVEWSKTKIVDLLGKAIPLKITVNSLKREIVYIGIDFDYMKKKKEECRERYLQYQHQQ
jgi:hypothetical protein